MDLVESLKKNEAIKEFVNRTLIEKVGETRTVTIILEIMSEKFDRNMGEKTLEMMRKISGEGFKSDESVDKMMDRFGDMIVEMKKIRLAENLEYAMGLQFLERLEKSSKVNTVEKKMLRDILEDADGNPRAGEILELMKKELKRMKVVENREEPFKKGIATNYLEDIHYVRNADDNRSRRDNWKRDKYVRSDSRPGYLRTASRGNYVRDNSSFRRNSNVRTGSVPGKFTGPSRNNSKNGGRFPSKTPERQKSELFKKVENLEKDNKEIKKTMEELKEILKGKVINGHFVGEEVECVTYLGT